MADKSSALELVDPAGVAPSTSYSHVSRAGDFVFVAGQIAKDAAGVWVGLGDAGAQARQVYVNIGKCLASVGATARDVVKINTGNSRRAGKRSARLGRPCAGVRS